MRPSEHKQPKSISLCMITKNEEEYLPHCLDSIRELTQEIIIVDTGSTDRTIEIAKEYGAQIYHHPWQEDYSLHRNQSISYAKGEWILIVDADEIIAKRDQARIRQIANNVSADAVYFILRNYENSLNLANSIANPGDYEEGAGFPCFIACDLIRLFRNAPAIRFTGQVHETVTEAIIQEGWKTLHSDIPIHHYGKVRKDRLKNKQKLYLELGIKRLQESPNDCMAYKGLCDQLLELGMTCEALEIANRGLEVFPEMIDIRFNRGLALDRLGRANDASREYEWILSRLPDHLGACHNLAQILLGENRVSESLQLLTNGIKFGIRHPAFFFLLGKAQAAAGDGLRALENFDMAIELQPNFPDINCHKAIILLHLNKHNDAVHALEKEIEIGGNIAAAYTLLGEISLYWNYKESAKSFFQKVLLIEPSNQTAQNHLNHLSELPLPPLS